MFIGIEQHIAQATNIIFFVPMAIISVAINIKHKLIKWKIAIPIIIAGIIGAIIGAEFSVKLDSPHLKKYFGIFLSLITIYEIYHLFIEYKIKKKRNNINNK
ncbi:MAG: TSUP family transporter [Oscillospiraceae bacterium]|nr:TSUP family transporter [Oscillospiraceae bacterium]